MKYHWPLWQSCSRFTKFVLVIGLFLAAVPAVRAGEYAWIEGESLAQRPDGFKSAGWGHKDFLSGGNWLFAAIDGADAEKIPADGLTLTFPFTLTTSGKHEVWARLGYEFVRAPLRWRVDEGAWGDNGPQDLTTDLMAIADWTEVAWVQLGTVDLEPGKHTLQIHYQRRVLPGKKQPERILAGLDCFCISKNTFHPNGPHKPDEQWQQPIDKKAANKIFAVPASADKQPRTVLPLSGAWQIARYDEQQIEDRAEPVKTLPAHYQDLFWKGIAVPGNRDKERPDLLYCHRFLYRTKIDVPAEQIGRSFVLRFPSTALLASVFVNGRYAAGNSTPCAAWDADITRWVRPGANEIVVAIKDIYYALEHNGEGKSVRFLFNVPPERLYRAGGLGMARFADFPVIFDVPGAGIFETPTLTVAGPVHVADVFCKPSVARQELGLEITLRNPTAKALTVQISNEMMPLTGGPAEKTFAVKEVEVPAGAEKVVQLTEAWARPKLWWPDEPHMYQAVTRLSVAGRVVDERRTKFGFREWGWSDRSFTLNGIPWHFRADLLHNGKITEPKKAVDDWKKSGVNTVRYWGYQPWYGNSQEETLDFYDTIGMPVRRSGIFDGQVASYLLVENKNGKQVARKQLFDNWIRQLEAWVKAERNHPSVFIWSIENEITYINARNFGWLEAVEPEIRRAIKAVMAVDPTRPAMIDGGDALRDQSLPIYGNHYNEAAFRHYPDEAHTFEIAYSRHKTDPRRYPWPLAPDRPLFLGESFFANGHPPAAYAALIGERAFLGRNEAEAGVRLFARMLAEGYRWHGVAAFHFWFAGDAPDNFHYGAFQPVCALPREWNTTFGSDQEVRRTLKIFNDTRYADPIELHWSFEVGSKPIASGKKTFAVPPGEAEVAAITFQTPAVKARTDAKLVLICRRQGEEVYRNVEPCHVLAATPKLTAADNDLLVYDPKGTVIRQLKEWQTPFRAVASLEDLPEQVAVLVIGPDALTPRQATDPRWLRLVAAGAKILVLDQEHPLHFQAVPADLEPTDRIGRIAFPENPDHPAFAGLAADDFFCWSGDHVVYRHVYKKATRGARSLLQCDDELSCTALVECPVRDGLLLLSQAVVGTRLADDPVAQRLFVNLVNYCRSYRPLVRPTTVVLAENDPRRQLLDAIGLKYRPATALPVALADAKTAIVIADAAPATLHWLAEHPAQLKTFAERGGSLLLWGLTPQGLADFNKIVGVEHLLRPFRMERVSLPPVRDPLLAGATIRDVAMESTERIFPWSGDRYPAKDTFTHIVSLDEVAPFAESAKTGHGWLQMTNGLTSADAWKFIFYHNLKQEGEQPRWSARLPRPEIIEEFSIIVNTHYQGITKLRLVFDDDRAGAVTLDLKPVAELRQDFPIPPRKFQRITLEPLEWTRVGNDQSVIGVDNLWIRVRREDEYRRRVVPLLNIGGLVKYRLGKGSLLLNQLHIPATEANPVNVEKKRNLVATLLHNLGAPFAAERLLIAGLNLKYQPLPLEEKCTAYLTAERGFLRSGPDLHHLPVGEQKFAGVTYVIRDFKTSPLPSCIMLASPAAKGDLPKAVTGIPVNTRADVLFFLHTFHKTRDWRAPSGKKKAEPPVIFEYVVTYDDGQTATVPVRLNQEAAHWLTEQPHGLPNAAVAWAAPLPDDSRKQAVVYQMSWTNPRPQEPIRSLAVRYHEPTGNSYGVPIVLAITAATEGS